MALSGALETPSVMTCTQVGTVSRAGGVTPRSRLASSAPTVATSPGAGDRGSGDRGSGAWGSERRGVEERGAADRCSEKRVRCSGEGGRCPEEGGRCSGVGGRPASGDAAQPAAAAAGRIGVRSPVASTHANKTAVARRAMQSPVTV